MRVLSEPFEKAVRDSGDRVAQQGSDKYVAWVMVADIYLRESRQTRIKPEVRSISRISAGDEGGEGKGGGRVTGGERRSYPGVPKPGFIPPDVWPWPVDYILYRQAGDLGEKQR